MRRLWSREGHVDWRFGLRWHQRFVDACKPDLVAAWDDVGHFGSGERRAHCETESRVVEATRSALYIGEAWT